jgi:putative ABC transport system permease protein
VRDFLMDVRYAARMARGSPGITAAVVLSLGLAIGGNTAVFSAVQAVLLRPLPFRDPDRLVWVWEKNPRDDRPRHQVSWASFAAVRDESGVFEDIGASTDLIANLAGEQPPDTVIGYRFSANFFRVLGTEPILGRTFLPGEDAAGRDHVVVLSYALWQRRFAGDPAVVGRMLRVNGEAHTVIGVMPPAFQHPPFVQIWKPLVLDPRLTEEPGARFLRVVGRLRPGVSVEEAGAAVQAVQARLGGRHPESHRGWGSLVAPIRSRYTDDVRPALVTLMGAMAFVFLIACANVAHLLLARTAARHREVAIRAAMGAGRARLFRQFLTESALLGLLGGGLGLLLAWWGVDLLLGLFPTGIANVAIPPRMDQIRLDGAVLAFTLAVSLIAGLVAGFVPAREASRLDLNETLKEAGRSGSGTPRGRRFQSALVVTEVASALVLVAGALLMVRSFLRLQEGNLGFDPDHVLTLRMSLPDYRYSTPARRAAFVEEALAGIRGVPGVEGAAETTFLPLSGWSSGRTFAVAGRAAPLRGQEPEAQFQCVSEDYFHVMRIALRKGRGFTAADRDGAPLVAVVNDTMARRFFPGEDPVGQRVDFRLRPAGAADTGPAWREIVGVVGDVRHQGLAQEPRPEIYVPYRQEPVSLVALAVRTSPPPEAMAAAVKGAVWAVDPEQPVLGVMGLDRLASESVALRRVSMVVLVTFAGIALALAAVGLYGVISFSVTRRTREIGVRMALGARRQQILAMVLRQGLTVTLAGVAFGVAAALALTRVMGSLLYGVSPTDAASLGAVVALLVTVAAASSYAPARRATRVDPAVALRGE